MCSAGCTVSDDKRLLEEETAIYLELAQSGPAGGHEIVISTAPLNAIGITGTEDVLTVFPAAPEAAIADFLSKNRSGITLEGDLIIDDRFVLLGSGNIDDRLADKYRYHFVSRIGFDAKRLNALVLYFNVCEPLCGEGGFFHLENRDGKWVIVAESEKIKT